MSRQAVGDAEQDAKGDSWSREVELGAIGVEMRWNVVGFDDVTQR